MSASLGEYIASFRIKELSQCLEQLGLSKRGRKLELQQRLLTYLADSQSSQGSAQPSSKLLKRNGAERVITQIWKQMHGLPADQQQHASLQHNHLDPIRERIESGAEASSSNSYSHSRSLAHLNTVKAALQSPIYSADEQLGRNNNQISCICGRNEGGITVQCEGESCGVWQHCQCVGIDPSATPEHYFCQRCRIALADPFWQADPIPLFTPAKLEAAPGRPVVMRPSDKEETKFVERAFRLSAGQLEPLRRNSQTEQLHVACLLLDDPVPNRIHWPRQAELKINSMVYRPYGRNSATKLGGNARDEPANAAHRCAPGPNRVQLMCVEDRPYCLMAYTVRRRTLEDVKKMMAPAESPTAAATRVSNTMHGRKAGDDDGDDDLLVSNTVISLKDPLSGTRIHTAARFVGLPGIVAFDLDCFLSMAQRSRKWQDPHTLKNVTVKQLQLDSWMQPVIDCLKGLPDVTEVEVNGEGLWRPNGTSMPWQSTVTDTGPLTIPQTRIKPDPEQAPDSGSEEESEGEELRKAAKAYTSANKQAKSQPEVIVLDSSSDDEAPINPRRQVPLSPPQAQPQLGSRQQPSSQPSSGQSTAASESLSSAALSQPSSWSHASSSRQLPASFQTNANSSAKPAGSGLRIKLNANAARQQQPQASQGLTHHLMTNGHSHASLHPADPPSSSSRLAAASMQPPVARQNPGPSNLGTKRKQYELDGQYGPYSQASAQAAGMSMSDHMQQAAGRSMGPSRLPPYPGTSISYGSRLPYGSIADTTGAQPSQPQPHSSPAYGRYPVSPTYWQHQQPVGSPSYSGGPAVGSSYRSNMPASPPYSPHYPSSNGTLQAMPDRDLAREEAQRDAAFLQSMHHQGLPGGSAPPHWSAQPLADGDDHLGQCASDDVMLDALLGTWHGASPERSNPGSNKQQQEARLAAWKARTDTATQQEFATGQANHDIIVLD